MPSPPPLGRDGSVLVVELRTWLTESYVDRGEPKSAGARHIYAGARRSVVSSRHALISAAEAVTGRRALSRDGARHRQDHCHSSCRTSGGAGTSPAPRSRRPCAQQRRLPPSSRQACSGRDGRPGRGLLGHHQYYSMVSPLQAKNGIPFGLSGYHPGPPRSPAAGPGSRRCCTTPAHLSAQRASVSISTAV